MSILFVNGIANTKQGACESLKELNDVLPEGKRAELVYNFASPTDKIIQDIAFGAVGVGGLSHSLEKENKKEGDFWSRLTGFGGAFLIGCALYDYSQMQEDKHTIALNLAKRVAAACALNPNEQVTLILHSQGADIGYDALKMLSKYKHRIDVLTLGAMTSIPTALANKVCNVTFRNDWVSRGLATPFDLGRQALDGGMERNVSIVEQEGVVEHRFSHYLNHDATRQFLSSI